MPSLKFLLTYSKQYYLCKVMKRFNSNSLISSGHVSLIKNMTGSSEEEVVKCLEINPDVLAIQEEDLSNSLKWIKGLELKDKKRLDMLLLVKHHPKTVRHRYLTLKELGISHDKITSHILSKYLTFIKMKVSLLKKKGLLAQDTDVVQNVLSCTPLSASQVDCAFSDSNTPDDIRVFVFKRLLMNVVGYTEPFKEETAILKRIRHKSIAETLRNLSVLQNDVGIPLEKIRNNPFLLSAADPDNTLQILSTFPSISGVNITTILNNHTKILASSHQSLVTIRQYLKDAEITDEALSKCFEVFTLNSETVRSRLEECSKHQFLSVCKHHPRVLELIIYQKKAKQRLDKLRKIKGEFISLNILASSDKHFNKYFEEGSDRCHGMDAVYFLSEELGCSRETIRSKLQRHPYWIYTSLLNISSNLKALRSRNFTLNEIVNEICILLYPTKLVLEELDKVSQRPEVVCCKDANGVLKRSCILPLSLYFIERESNFSGSSIWFRDCNQENKLFDQQPEEPLPDRSSISSTLS